MTGRSGILHLTRRGFLRSTGTVAALAAGGPLLTACGGTDKGKTLPTSAIYTPTPSGEVRYICWESFAPASITAPYEKFGARVALTFMGSIDEMYGKLRASGGVGYDAVNSTSDVVIPMAQAGLIAPIDTSSMPNYQNVRAQLTRSDLWEYNGKPYAVPLDWGSTVLLANTRRLGPLPDVVPYDMFLDPQFRGRITTMDDLSVIFATAAYMGYKQYWALTNQQLTDVQLLLIDKLLPNVRKFSSTFADEANLFANDEVDVAWGWTGAIRQALLASNVTHVTEHVLTPGMPWYVDCISAVAKSENLGTVAHWMDYNFIPEVAANRFKANALPTVVPAAASFLSPEQQIASYLTPDRESFWTNLDPELQWHPVARRSLYQAVWNSVKAGTRQFPG